MSRFSRTAAFLALFAVAVLGGCTQWYTGGIGMGDTEAKATSEYEKFKAEQAAQRAAAQRELELSQPANFENANPGATSGRGFATAQTQRTSGAIGLYGQLSAMNRARASAMDGTGALRRVSFTTEGADFDPDVDPTGRFLVYASTRHRKTSDLYLQRVDGSAVTQLTDDPANDAMPCISPSGTQVAFCSDRSGSWDIYVMDIEGGAAVQITRSPNQNIHPSFSPDGSQIVYSSFGSASGQWELVIVDVANPAVKRVIGHGLFPQWSPTDNRILFQRARQRGTRWFSVWTVALENGEAVRPTELAVSTNAAVITPEWSDDGRNIVFCTVIDPQSDDSTRPSHADLWIMSADGSGRTRLTTGQYANLQPTWSADGSIYFVSNRAGDNMETIWALQPEKALRVAESMRSGGSGRSAGVPETPKSQNTNLGPGTSTAEVPTSP